MYIMCIWYEVKKGGKQAAQWRQVMSSYHGSAVHKYLDSKLF